MGTADKTSQSRSNDELKEAIAVVEKEIAGADFSNPNLFLQLPTIRESLKELLDIRKRIGAGKETKEDVFVTNREDEEKEPIPPSCTNEYESSITNETSTNDGKVQTESQKFIAD